MFKRPPVDPLGIPIAVGVGCVSAAFLPPRAVAVWVVVTLLCGLGIFVPFLPILRAVASAYRAALELLPWRLLRSRRGGGDEAGKTKTAHCPDHTPGR